jgi:hypothetical protein
MITRTNLNEIDDKRSFTTLTENPPDTEIPWLDRSTVDEAQLTQDQESWRRDGVKLLSSVTPEVNLQSYENWRRRRQLRDDLGALPISYGYMYVKEIRDIVLAKPVHDRLFEIFQEPMAIHFDLTQWKSTERAWHQDDYLNDQKVNGHYAAIWFAIDDVHRDSGPFEFVLGSHAWPVMRRSRIKALLPEDEANSPYWPQKSEQFVAKAFADEIERRRSQVETFIGRRGDALIWHARLVHRGSLPKNPHLARKSIIGHYTAVSKVDPQNHEIRHTSDGVPYIYHKQLQFKDWEASSGVAPFEPNS